ncbi:pyridoxine kinase [Colletotrichum sojae]|uniref:pyridoxal kinase n=1 Tax=Colletotrichum sojae TaxID=2175907 RepID=A0A8H6MLL4_9PEZI|nr:pyridoxine kinase [Colletotrichum sojae]
MTPDLPVPDTRVLAVASHVVSGNVGNKIAVFTLQSLGCDVAALNTVQFSNHTGYRQWKGTKVSAQEIRDLFEGLRQSYLDDFDMMLSGYIPGAEAVVAVGDIAKELKAKEAAAGKKGSFFWVLDPVMGDNGKLYVAEEVVPAYQSLIEYADLILPNQFEAEYVTSPSPPPFIKSIPKKGNTDETRLLSGVKITDMDSLQSAIRALHSKYRIPHIVITSVSLAAPDHPPSHLSVVGSSMNPATGEPRLFKIVFSAIDAYFSGTGDMFAALMTVRMREAVIAAGGDLGKAGSWLSGADVGALDLPLARATEKVLASMHEVLAQTARGMQEVVEAAGKAETEEEQKKLHLLKSKSAELKLVRNLACLRDPVVEFRARKL